jgi:hypothetical protein
MDKESLKAYILCEYNRDADSYRSEIQDFPHDYLYIVLMSCSPLALEGCGH